MALKPGQLRTLADVAAWIYASDARTETTREHDAAVTSMVRAYQKTVQDKIDALHDKIDATNTELSKTNKQLGSLDRVLYKAVGAAWLGGVVVGAGVTIASAYIIRG